MESSTANCRGVLTKNRQRLDWTSQTGCMHRFQWMLVHLTRYNVLPLHHRIHAPPSRSILQTWFRSAAALNSPGLLCTLVWNCEPISLAARIVVLESCCRLDYTTYMHPYMHGNLPKGGRHPKIGTVIRRAERPSDGTPMSEAILSIHHARQSGARSGTTAHSSAQESIGCAAHARRWLGPHFSEAL